MAGQGMRAGCKQRAFDTGNIGDGLLHTLLVWTAQRVAHMRNRMPLHFELHADKQQRKHEHGRSAGDHGDELMDTSTLASLPHLPVR